jgi:hypothetical protein
MNQPISVAEHIGLAEFTAYMNGCSRNSPKQDEFEAPSGDWWEAQQERINSTPELTGVGNA